MFCMENATEAECQEFINWVKENYATDDPEKKEAVEILSRYYVTRALPLCGMKSWFKRDYARFCNGDKYAVERHKRKEYVPVYHDSTNGKINDPSWRGPNGNWSLD